MNDVVHAFDTHTKGSRDVSYRLVSHESVGGTGVAFEEGQRDPERNTSRERERERVIRLARPRACYATSLLH